MAKSFCVLNKRYAALQQKLCGLITIKAKRKSKTKGSKSIQKMGDSRDPLNSSDMMQPEKAAFIWKKAPSQMKCLLAGRHTDPWALVLSFAESHLCLLYHQSAKAQPIMKPLNNNTDTQSEDHFSILDPTHLWTLRNDQRLLMRSHRNQYFTPFLWQKAVWSPVTAWITGQTTNSAKTCYEVRRW